MKLYNLKDHNEQVSFAQAVTQGLGKNQGLFFPHDLPEFSLTEIDEMLKLDFVTRSAKILSAFIGDEIPQEIPSFTQYEVRSALAKCGLTTKHIESQVRVLSGGEQAKVRLCKLINRDTNILLLDEPTNHLDVDAKDSLKKALQEYRGSILLICH